MDAAPEDAARLRRKLAKAEAADDVARAARLRTRLAALEGAAEAEAEAGAGAPPDEIGRAHV